MFYECIFCHLDGTLLVITNLYLRALINEATQIFADMSIECINNSSRLFASHLVLTYN